MEEAKPKTKRKSPPKKAMVVEEVSEPVVEVKEESPKESPIETIEPPKKVKTLELVKCPKCNKEMTKRTLRYDHDKSCKGAPIKREDIPVQKRIKKVSETQKQTVPLNIPEEIIEQEVKKRIQNTIQDRMHQRLKLKEEKIKKLATQIA